MLTFKKSQFVLGLLAGLILTLSWQIIPCLGEFSGKVSANSADIPPTSSLQNSAYRWRNVATGGGGFVTGMIIHPQEADLIYIRTDVGGAYRWENSSQSWIPLMEMFGRSQSHLFGIESIAIDPNNPNLIYAATGEYTDSRSKKNGVILKSTNRGQSWTQVPLSFKLGANEDWRWNGERLAVDPNQPNLLYLGSRHNGLWKSADSATTWKKVDNFPTQGTANRGITFVLFDPNSSSSGKPTQTVYIGVAGSGIYRSQDAGKSWNLLKTEAVNPQRGVVAADGTLYVTFDNPGAIKKFKNNTWTDITPTKVQSFNAISVDPKNPNFIIAAEWFFNHGNKLFKSTNGGQNWQEIQYSKQATIPWQKNDDRFWASGISSIAIDPHHAQRVWYTDGWGIWRTDNINAGRSSWQNVVAGQEEIVNFALKSLPETGILLEGSADIGGLRHENLNQYPNSLMQSPSWMVSDFVSIDASEQYPNFAVSVGSRRWTSDGLPDPGYGVYSTDAGKSWAEFADYPQGYRKAQRGRVAVSATSDRQIVWVPEGENAVPYYTSDRGKTWKPSQGAPSGTTTTVWQWNQPLTSDRINGNKFYLYKDGQVYRSTDGGANWSVTATNLPNLNMDWENNAWSSLKAAPRIEGEVWASFNTMGLYRSSDSGSTFTQLNNVQQAHLFAFGKNAPGKTNPTVFVYGKVNQIEGIFRSDDFGKNWVKIDVPGQAIGKDPKSMEGDRAVYGRVYIGTGGRGIYYGEPVNTPVALNSSSSGLNCKHWLASFFR